MKTYAKTIIALSTLGAINALFLGVQVCSIALIVYPILI
jgi:hypothetical protein